MGKMEHNSKNEQEDKTSRWKGKVLINSNRTRGQQQKEDKADEKAEKEFNKIVEANRRKNERLAKIKLKQNSKDLLPEKRIWLSKELMDKILEQDNPADVLALYMFYRYTVIWQGTYQVKATDDFCMQGLKFGRNRFRNAKQALVKLKLIRQIRIKRKDNTFGKCYIKVNLYFRSRSVVFRRAVINKTFDTDTIDES